ncbi:unnamed protein product [Polarella glacialis]|uniref:CobW/HypB/UreG nucleotide-binding domain-containing protein n=1 Tax=Polarella glacialis TaxID=89957 RepID=A0A813I7Q5_POLGL|nr:unnamed protein product [Polarella glacialis]
MLRRRFLAAAGVAGAPRRNFRQQLVGRADRCRVLAGAAGFGTFPPGPFAECAMLDFDDEGGMGGLGGGMGFFVGIVVNDVAEANIDSEVLSFEDADGIVGLQNGCACCSGRDDLFARLQELVESSGAKKLEKPWDRLVVECSGVAEPESIASELEAMGQRGEPVMRRIFLAGIICVVDASCFWEMYNSSDAGDAERRPLSVLLVSQLESADTVIINKTDLVGKDELDRLTQLLTAMCPSARQLLASRGALPLRTLLPAEPIDLDMPAYVPTLANRHGASLRSVASASARLKPAPDHGHGHGHSHSHSHGEGEADCSVCNSADAAVSRHDRFGLTSFVYRCKDRVFDPKLLANAARSLPVVAAELGFPHDTSGDLAPAAAFAGILRSKGFIRVEGSKAAYYWSHAGRRLEVCEASGAPLGCAGQELVLYYSFLIFLLLLL